METKEKQPHKHIVRWNGNPNQHNIDKYCAMYTTDLRPPTIAHTRNYCFLYSSSAAPPLSSLSSTQLSVALLLALSLSPSSLFQPAQSSRCDTKEKQLQGLM